MKSITNYFLIIAAILFFVFQQGKKAGKKPESIII
jgi:hypothetical protein